MLGWLPRDSKLQIPERHLGFGAGENIESKSLIAASPDAVTERFDLGRNHGDRPDSGRFARIPRTAARRESSIQRPVSLCARR